MERYPAEISSILAPLVVVQGLGEGGLPEGTVHETTTSSTNSTVRTLSTDKSVKLVPFKDPESPLNYDLNAEDVNDGFTVLKREFPNVQAASGLELASLLNTYNIGDSYWLLDNNKEYQKQINYNIKFISDKFAIPNTKQKGTKQHDTAASLPSVPTSPITETSTISSPLTEINVSSVTNPIRDSTSPLSPFNPNSQFYNSILPFEWIQKYRELRPFVFISVHELVTADDTATNLEDEDRNLADELIRMKAQCTSNGLKFLSLILCSKSTALNPELDERIANLRKVTGLPARSGMLFLPAGTQRELEAFAMSVLHLIKPWSVEYFNALEKKFKKRTILNLEYPEKFWLARQALKSALISEMKGITDYSTKSLEYCYEKLIDVLKELNMETQPKLWQQCRMWLDFTGIHITRSYFIMGDGNMAYKKFDIHIQNVMAVLPPEIIQTYPVMGWISLQFTWLSQLVELVPEKLVPIDRSLQPWIRTKWFGGTSDIASDLLLPNGGYLYLQACSLMRRRHQLAEIAAKETKPIIDSYLSLPLDKELKFEFNNQCVKLLSSSLDFFSRAKETKFARTEAYIYFQLGEEYFGMKNYAQSIINFLVSLTAYKNENWNSITGIILFRLYQCCIKTGNHRDALLYFIQLSLLDEKLIKPFMKLINMNDIDESKIEEDVSFKESLFDKLISFKNQSLSLSENLQFQLVLTPKINKLMEKLEVEEISIEFQGGFKKIKIINDIKEKSKTFHEFKDGDLENNNEVQFQSNLNFDDKRAKCFNFELTPNRIGSFSIQSIQLKVKSSALSFENQLKLVPSISPRLKWAKPSICTTFNKDFDYDIVPRTKPHLCFVVIPKQPKIDCRIKHAEQCYNGQIFPIAINFENQDPDKFGLHMSVAAYIEGQSIKTKWNKDEEYSKFCNNEDLMHPSSPSKSENILFVFLPLISDLPLFGQHSKEQLKLELRYNYLINNNDQMSIENVKKISIPVFEQFNLQFSISPAINSIIPSIFNIGNKDKPNPEGGQMGLSVLPIHERIWNGACSVKNMSSDSMTILGEYKIMIKPTTQNTKCELISMKNKRDEEILLSDSTDDANVKFEFSSSCLENHLKRSINTEIYLDFKYSFKSHGESGMDIIDKYEGLIWKGSLPHLDPRLLVSMKRIEQKQSLHTQDVFEIDYILENPTNRIFQFSSSLGTSENWKIFNYKNSFNFLLMPFMKQVIKFKYQLIDGAPVTTRLIKLPEFKVYDLNYKVYLNNLIVSGNLKAGKDGIYYVNDAV